MRTANVPMLQTEPVDLAAAVIGDGNSEVCSHKCTSGGAKVLAITRAVLASYAMQYKC